ncbi:DUF1080 domain-containing protein [Candidatus Poribacteria bacterium]|nr:DUF1080 domain-containing protein [Candidatus Poribacteria bacterium]
MLSESEKAESWISLFDGTTLNGWRATGETKGWMVDDGSILCTLQGGKYLYTLEQFDDFILAIDFKITPRTNSGIFVRWGDLNDAVHTGIEIQILDTHGKTPTGTHDCGAVYDALAPTRNVCKPTGEWNHTVITCDKNIITVEMNDEKIVEADLDLWTTPGMNPDGTKNKFRDSLKDMPRCGHIGLQDHGGKIWFRNIKLKRL